MNATKRQHTPGPWHVKQTGFTYFRDLTILGADWHGEETPIAAALVRNALHPYGRADKARAEIEANARLIASAPDLLNLMTAATRLDELTGENLAVYARTFASLARAAIARATEGGAL